MSDESCWAGWTILLGGASCLLWTGSPGATSQTSESKSKDAKDAPSKKPAEAKQVRKTPAPAVKAIAGDRVYYTARGVSPEGFANGEPKELLVELNRLVTTKWPKEYPSGKAHLHPWRKKWDEFRGPLEAHGKASAYVLQCDSFQEPQQDDEASMHWAG